MEPNCPYCAAPVAPQELCECPECATPHHVDCWRENAGCTVYGCSQAPEDEPKISLVPTTLGQTVQPPAASYPTSPPPLPTAYFVFRMGIQEGPYYEPEVRRRLSTGQISWNDLLWQEGMSQWMPAEKVLR